MPPDRLVQDRPGHGTAGGPVGHAVPLVVCASASMLDLVRQAVQAAASDAKVLITGESGVGKDLVAHTIHGHSSRSSGPLVAVNCASFPDTLLESELFGHVRGSFTGAHRDRSGQIQQAHRGTLFLDEVAEMSLRMQALLLRVLESGEIQPVGADRPAARVDVRVIAATNRDLDERVAEKTFREDLLYRLRVVHLHVPPLRERPEDVPPLVTHFVAGAGRPVTVSDDALRLLQAYRWPGNVRELRNVIEQTLALCQGPTISAGDLPAHVRTPGSRPASERERRRQVADDLFEALVGGGCSFWEHVHPLFLSRDLTRHDVRELVRRGLARTRGNYRALLTLFGIGAEDYKKFLNFLAAHDCSVDYRPFRNAGAEPVAAARAARVALPGEPLPQRRRPTAGPTRP